MDKSVPKGFAGITELFSDIDMDALAKKASEKAKEVRSTPDDASSKKPHQAKKVFSYNIPPAFWWAAIILFVVWVASQSDNTPKHRSSSYVNSSSQTQFDAGKYTFDETVPSMGSNNTLTYSQIRYCLSEKIRAAVIKENINQYSDSEVDKFNALVEDYNSRCGSFRYPDGAVEYVQKQIDEKRSDIIREGMAKLSGWRDAQ
jgi:hypothetical protein